QSEVPALLRSGALSHRAVRPAWLRAFHAARGAGREYDLAPRGRHRAAARAPRHRALAGVWWFLGLDARAGLRAGAPAARDRARPARHLHAAPLGTGMVLPEGVRRALSRCVGALPRADPGGRTRGPDECLPPPP